MPRTLYFSCAGHYYLVMHIFTMYGKSCDCKCPLGADHDENQFLAFINATSASLEQYRDILLYDMKKFGINDADYDVWIDEFEMVTNILKYRKENENG